MLREDCFGEGELQVWVEEVACVRFLKDVAAGKVTTPGPGEELLGGLHGCVRHTAESSNQCLMNGCLNAVFPL
jgi:hypothetical protein